MLKSAFLSRMSVICLLVLGSVAMTGAEDGTRVGYRELYYPTGGTQISSENARLLGEVVSALKSTPGANVNLVGHTDNVGSDKGNRALALKRAEAVADFLVGAGVSADRITALGAGMSKPKYDNGTADGRGKNRRVEVVVVAAPMGVMSTFAAVMDENGEFVRGLGAGNFEIMHGGVKREVVKVVQEDEGAPTSVVLALDKSASSIDAMSFLKQAAKSFVRNKRPQDQVLVLTFSSDVKMANRFSSDNDELMTAIDGITAHGYTRLYDALLSGVQRLKELKPPRIMILLTDGKDERGMGKRGSDATLEQALSAAVSNNVTVITVGLGDKIDAGTLRAIALATGGSAFQVTSPDKLDQLYASISQGMLRGKYRIDFKSATNDPSAVVINSKRGRAIGLK